MAPTGKLATFCCGLSSAPGTVGLVLDAFQLQGATGQREAGPRCRYAASPSRPGCDCSLSALEGGIVGLAVRWLHDFARAATLRDPATWRPSGSARPCCRCAGLLNAIRVGRVRSSAVHHAITRAFPAQPGCPRSAIWQVWAPRRASSTSNRARAPQNLVIAASGWLPYRAAHRYAAGQAVVPISARSCADRTAWRHGADLADGVRPASAPRPAGSVWPARDQHRRAAGRRWKTWPLDRRVTTRRRAGRSAAGHALGGLIDRVSWPPLAADHAQVLRARRRGRQIPGHEIASGCDEPAARSLILPAFIARSDDVAGGCTQ